MNRVVNDQLELKFDAEQVPVPVPVPVKVAAVVSTAAGAQVVRLSTHLARKAVSRESNSTVPDSDSALIDRIANRVRFF